MAILIGYARRSDLTQFAVEAALTQGTGIVAAIIMELLFYLVIGVEVIHSR